MGPPVWMVNLNVERSYNTRKKFYRVKNIKINSIELTLSLIKNCCLAVLQYVCELYTWFIYPVITVLLLYLYPEIRKETLKWSKCDASQQIVPFVGRAYLEILIKIAGKIERNYIRNRRHLFLISSDVAFQFW